MGFTAWERFKVGEVIIGSTEWLESTRVQYAVMTERGIVYVSFDLNDVPTELKTKTFGELGVLIADGADFGEITMDIPRPLPESKIQADPELAKKIRDAFKGAFK